MSAFLIVDVFAFALLFICHCYRQVQTLAASHRLLASACFCIAVSDVLLIIPTSIEALRILIVFVLVFIEMSILLFQLTPVLLLKTWLTSMKSRINFPSRIVTIIAFVYITNALLTITIVILFLYVPIDEGVRLGLTVFVGVVSLLNGLAVMTCCGKLLLRSGIVWAHSPDLVKKANQLIRLFFLALLVTPPLFASLFPPAGSYIAPVLFWLFNILTLYPRDALQGYSMIPDLPPDEELPASYFDKKTLVAEESNIQLHAVN